MREKDQIFIATFSENAVQVSRKFGLQLELNDLCISESLDEERRARTMAEIEREIRESGAEQVIIHGPFTEVIPASIDHRAVEMGMERLQEAYVVAEAIGASRMVVHSGYMPLLYFRQWHQEKSVTFWKTYMADKPKDFRIYIENVFEDTPQMMSDLIDAIDDSRVKICLDVGHANVTTSPDYDVHDWIRLLGERIGHLHLHNNDGGSDQHRPVMEGSLDMERILRDIDTYCGPEATVTIESHSCETSAKWMTEVLGL